MTTAGERRNAMVVDQIVARGVRDPRVLDAMCAVPREAFVSAEQGGRAYDDTPLSIEEGQTISQPYMVAYMIESMRIDATDRVLEVGTGSGYAAAVLAEVAGEVYTIERHERLAKVAAHRLGELGYRNVHVRHGDGALGWPQAAPFAAIVVAAVTPHVPPALLTQLDLGGRLVLPIGEHEHDEQMLVRIVRVSEDKYESTHLGPVRFVPLLRGTSAPQ